MHHPLLEIRLRHNNKTAEVIDRKGRASKMRQKWPYAHYIGPKMCWGQETEELRAIQPTVNTHSSFRSTTFIWSMLDFVFAGSRRRLHSDSECKTRRQVVSKYKKPCTVIHPQSPQHNFGTGNVFHYYQIQGKQASNVFELVWLGLVCRLLPHWTHCRLTNEFKVDCTRERKRSVRSAAAAALVLATLYKLNKLCVVHSSKFEVKNESGSRNSCFSSWNFELVEHIYWFLFVPLWWYSGIYSSQLDLVVNIILASRTSWKSVKSIQGCEGLRNTDTISLP